MRPAIRVLVAAAATLVVPIVAAGETPLARATSFMVARRSAISFRLSLQMRLS